MFRAQLCILNTRTNLVIVPFISLCFTTFLLALLLCLMILLILVSVNKLYTCFQIHCDTLLPICMSCVENLLQNILFCFGFYEFRFLFGGVFSAEPFFSAAFLHHHTPFFFLCCMPLKDSEILLAELM